MKKLLFAIVLSCSILSLTAQTELKSVNFTSGSLSNILVEAADRDKLVFVDVYTTWCGPCKFMTSNVFTNAAVVNYMNSTFINAKYDAEQGEGLVVARKYDVDRYPTFLILSQSGELLGRMTGAAPATVFLSRLKKMIKQIEQR